MDVVLIDNPIHLASELFSIFLTVVLCMYMNLNRG